MHIYIYMPVYAYVCVLAYVSMRVHMFPACVNACVCVCVFTRGNACMCACVSVRANYCSFCCAWFCTPLAMRFLKRENSCNEAYVESIPYTDACTDQGKLTEHVFLSGGR
jgi:hypothetical protein